jgi:hypothetical protein
VKVHEAKKRVKRAIRRCDGLVRRAARLEHKLLQAYVKAEKAQAKYIALKWEKQG